MNKATRTVDSQGKSRSYTSSREHDVFVIFHRRGPRCPQGNNNRIFVGKFAINKISPIRAKRLLKLFQYPNIAVCQNLEFGQREGPWSHLLLLYRHYC